MTKRFTAIIIIANIIMGLLLFLSSQSALIILSGEPHPVIVAGVNIFSIYIAYAQVGSSPIPTIAWSLPNFPFYVFLFFLIINAYFIIRLQRSKETKQNPSQTNIMTF